MTDNRFPHAHTVIDRAQRRIPHLAGALVRQDVEALVELARQQADELDRLGRARLALAAVRLIATESVTDDAGLLRRAILDQLPAGVVADADEAEHPAVWIDPTSGTAYDLTRTWRDAEGAFWWHAGWVGLPGEPRVPLMLWCAVSQPGPGGIRRMSDLATLRAVIDDCGPLVALPAEASDEGGAEP